MEDKTGKHTVLVVDDTPENIDVLNGLLSLDYKVKVAINGEKALKIADSKNPPDIILLDIMMPGIDGYKVCEELKNKETTKDIPIIFLTGLTDEQNESKGLHLGAVDYITKPFSPELVKVRVRNHLALKLHRDHLEELVRERTRELALTQEVTIESMGTLAEYRDPETGGHIKRTQNYIKVLSNHLKKHPKFADFLNSSTIELFYKSTPLHDIGKVGVPDNILRKPGKLTSEEFEIMKKHTVYGRNTLLIAEKRLGRYSFLNIAGEIAYTHHEKWDGSGYPCALKGEDIPLSGRLMAIADVYDALISKRVYKPPFPYEEAVRIITEGRGSHFDPDIVEAFLQIKETFREIAFEFADFEEERLALK
ncbi:response regulator receiver modulated metal dependent phosphohydrolase [Candidatus Magnetoovum chiemensis]|nr:response regulator receiver modulated metal dependent phosphohydrolase [Candidatus Magnetoovum chiemensis]